MSVLAECPACRRKQALTNKVCKKCGFNLVNAKKSNKVPFHVRRWVPGQNKYRSELVGTSLKEAKEKDAEYKADNRKVATGLIDNIPAIDLSFEDLGGWFMGLHTTKKLKDFKAKGIHFGHFNRRFGKTKVVRLRKSALKNFQAELKDSDFSDRYIDYIIADARQAVKTAIDDDIISADCLKPFNKTPRLLKKRGNARDKVFTPDQYERLYAAAKPHLKPIIAMAWYTGMREGEILNLKRSRLFLGDRCIKLRPEDTKEKRKKWIPIPDPLHEILSALPTAIHTEYVFLYRSKPIKDIRYAFGTAIRSIGLEYGRAGGYVFHDLRHSFVTQMRKAGVPESVIMSITGHVTRSMFDRYNKVDTSDKENAAARFMSYLSESRQNSANSDQNSDQTQKTRG